MQDGEEARHVYYSQEFRFSSTYGWHILYEWLQVIGEANRPRLRHLTIEHPAIPGMLETTWTRSCDEIAQNDLLLLPVPNNFPVTTYRESGKKSRAKKRQELFREWMSTTDPVDLILELHELRVLRFTFFNPHQHEDLSFAETTQHPIHATDFSRLSKAQLVVANLRSHLGGRGNEIVLKPKFDRGRNPPFVGYMDPDAADELLDKAGAMFIAVKRQGWMVEEAIARNQFPCFGLQFD
jgi:hypothetical protein